MIATSLTVATSTGRGSGRRTSTRSGRKLARRACIGMVMLPSIATPDILPAASGHRPPCERHRLARSSVGGQYFVVELARLSRATIRRKLGMPANHGRVAVCVVDT